MPHDAGMQPIVCAGRYDGEGTQSWPATSQDLPGMQHAALRLSRGHHSPA